MGGRLCFNTYSLTLNSGFRVPIDVVDQTGLTLQAKVCGDTTEYIEFRQRILEVQR